MLNKKRLKELMEERYIKNVKELSREAHVPYSTLNRMMQGRDMHLSSVVELARYLKVPVDELISKTYFIVSYTDTEQIVFKTSNFMEVTLKIILRSKGIENILSFLV